MRRGIEYAGGRGGRGMFKVFVVAVRREKHPSGRGERGEGDYFREGRSGYPSRVGRRRVEWMGSWTLLSWS